MSIERSASRKWWLLLGGGVAFLLLFGLLERFIRPAPSSSSGSEERTEADAPKGPTVRRLKDGTIEIRHDMFRRSSIRLEDDDEAQALFDCISRGIEESFGGDGSKDWSSLQARIEVRRIRDECMQEEVELPEIPPVPQPPTD